MFPHNYIITKLKWCHIGSFWHILAGFGGCLTQPRHGMGFCWGHCNITPLNLHMYVYIYTYKLYISFIKLPLASPLLGLSLKFQLGSCVTSKRSDPILYQLFHSWFWAVSLPTFFETTVNVCQVLHKSRCLYFETFQALWTRFWF